MVSSLQIFPMKELRKNKNLVILKPDKGNGVVVLDRTADTSKFRTIESDPTLLRENVFSEH